jgi:hypothetical protein
LGIRIRHKKEMSDLNGSSSDVRYEIKDVMMNWYREWGEIKECV